MYQSVDIAVANLLYSFGHLLVITITYNYNWL
jgi:hypothetical protein